MWKCLLSRWKKELFFMEYMTHALIGWFFAWHFVFIFCSITKVIFLLRDYFIKDFIHYLESKSIFAIINFFNLMKVLIFFFWTRWLILAQCVIMLFFRLAKGHFNLLLDFVNSFALLIKVTENKVWQGSSRSVKVMYLQPYKKTLWRFSKFYFC